MTTRETEKAKLSIIIVVHDQAMLLEQNLSLFLSQQYEAAYEVIVVDDSSTDDTPDVLQHMKAQYPHLYTTFIPKSVIFNPSRLRIAMNVGSKAAHHDRVMFASIDRPPKSDTWLEELATQMTNEDEVILIYNGRRQQDTVRYQIFSELEEAHPLIYKAERCSGKGHRGRWFKFLRGHYEAAVVKRSRIHDVIGLFDRPVKGFSLFLLSLRTLWKNI